MKSHNNELMEQKNGKIGLLSGKAEKCIILFSVLLLLLLPLNAIAGKNGRSFPPKDRFVLDFGDSHFRGHRGDTITLPLKKALRDQYPWVKISDYQLRKVVLVAKTKRGRGRVQLRVGPEVTDFYRVGGHPRDFYMDHRGSFDKIRIRNPFHDSWGPWQLFLRGNFKVRKVVLVVERRQRHKYGWSDKDEWHEPHHNEWRSNDGRFSFKMRW